MCPPLGLVGAKMVCLRATAAGLAPEMGVVEVALELVLPVNDGVEGVFGACGTRYVS